MSLLQRTFPGPIDRPRPGPEARRRERSLPRAAGLLSWLLALALALVAGCAGTPRGAGDAPLLWRASQPAAGDLYLFGSIHMGRRDGGDFGPAVAGAYAASDELVVEVDLSSVSPEEAAASNAAHALLPPGQTLRDVLSEATWALLVARLAEHGTPLAAVVAMQPWAVASLLAVIEFQAAGYDAAHGVDQRFMERAEGQLPIRSLETVDSQLQMLSSLSPRIQELMLVDMLTRTGAVRDEVVDLMDAWSRGDEARLVALLFSPLAENPELADFYEAVFFVRNEAMADQLAELAADGRSRFVVLGAGHMVGARGIPALLGKRGFAVDALQPLSPMLSEDLRSERDSSLQVP
jgi:uncharacterized protein YbaP (TraB family)